MDIDAVNSGFVLTASLLAWNNFRILYKERELKGVSLLTSAFFTICSIWNIYYYRNLSQPLSFYCGINFALANISWVSLATLLKVKSKLSIVGL